MKKIFSIAAALVVFAACEKLSLDMPNDHIESDNSGQNAQNDKSVKNFTFTIKGDFGSPTFSRAYMQADGKDMTDLWVFDYMDGKCVQTLHQTPADEDWGTPKMPLLYGSHHVYFVASRGANPTVNDADHVISWATTSDTFWKDYEVTVVSSSNGNRAVTLDRVVTKIVLNILDEIPANASLMSVTPETWYYGLDYVTGNATDAQKKERTMSIADTYIGTSGTFAPYIYGLSGKQEWTTDISVVAKDKDGKVIGSVNIEDAPFKQNRSTEYSGNLFHPESDLEVQLSDTWTDAVKGSF